jgi:hypothetical protein
MDNESDIFKCLQAVKDLEDANKAQMKNINRKLKGVGHALETLHKQQDEAGLRPLSEELIARKARASELFI